MIIAIINQEPGVDRGSMPRGLAQLRARSGRRTCIVDAGAGRHAPGLQPVVDHCAVSRRGLQHDLADWRHRFDDILLDVRLCSSNDCWDSLCAACVAIIVLPPAAPARHDALLARLSAVRLFNPGLRIVLALSCDPAAADAAALDAARALTARLGAAATAVFGGASRCCAAGRCGCAGAGALQVLYRAVYGAPQANLTAEASCAA